MVLLTGIWSKKASQRGNTASGAIIASQISFLALPDHNLLVDREAQKRREKERRIQLEKDLDARLEAQEAHAESLDDYVLVRLAQQTEATVQATFTRVSDFVGGRHRHVRQEIGDTQRQLADMRRRAQRLPDGHAVFFTRDGREAYDEFSRKLEGAVLLSALGMRRSGNAVAFEDYKKTFDSLNKLYDQDKRYTDFTRRWGQLRATGGLSDTAMGGQQESLMAMLGAADRAALDESMQPSAFSALKNLFATAHNATGGSVPVAARFLPQGISQIVAQYTPG